MAVSNKKIWHLLLGRIMRKRQYGYDYAKIMFEQNIISENELLLPILPFPENFSATKWKNEIQKLPWKEQLFQGALFPIDPRFLSLPLSLRYGDENKQVFDRFYSDRLKPDWEWAKRLIQDNAPKHLYKYRSVNDHSIENFENDFLWMSRADSFNDPFDSVNLIGFCTEEDYIKHHRSQAERFLEISKKNYTEQDPYLRLLQAKCSMTDDEVLNEENAWNIINAILNGEITDISDQDRIKYLSAFYVRKYKNEFRFRVNAFRTKGWIGCLSERNDSVLMWSYYANSHSGFCLEYESMAMYESPYIRHNMYPVNYMQEDANWVDCATGMDWLALYASLRKNSQWAHEKEWRIVFPEFVKDAYIYTDKPTGWNLKMPTPTSVYIGAFMKDEAEKKIIKIAHAKGMKIYKEVLNYRSLNVEFKEL